MKNLTWQNPGQLFVAQELIKIVKLKCCGIKGLQGTGIAESAKLSPWAMWSSKWNSLDVSGWIGLSAGLRF